MANEGKFWLPYWGLHITLGSAVCHSMLCTTVKVVVGNSLQYLQYGNDFLRNDTAAKMTSFKLGSF